MCVEFFKYFRNHFTTWLQAEGSQPTDYTSAVSKEFSQECVFLRRFKKRNMQEKSDIVSFIYRAYRN